MIKQTCVSYPSPTRSICEEYGSWRVSYPEHVYTWEGYSNHFISSFVCVSVCLSVCLHSGAKNYWHYFLIYHTTLKKEKKNLQIFPFSLPPLSFLSFPLSPLPIPATPFLILLMTNRGTKREKKRKTNKQTKKNRALHWAYPSVWPLLCFVCISFFYLSHCIPYHNTCWYCFI